MHEPVLPHHRGLISRHPKDGKSDRGDLAIRGDIRHAQRKTLWSVRSEKRLDRVQEGVIGVLFLEQQNKGTIQSGARWSSLRTTVVSPIPQKRPVRGLLHFRLYRPEALCTYARMPHHHEGKRGKPFQTHRRRIRGIVGRGERQSIPTHHDEAAHHV